MINQSFEIVSNDYILDEMDMNRYIRLCVAQKILETLSLEIGNQMIIFQCNLQEYSTSSTRSFLIVPDSEDIQYGEAKITITDAINICKFFDNIDMTMIQEGIYLFIGIEHVRTTTGIIKSSLLVVHDDISDDEFDYDTMIREHDALLNNQYATVGNYILLRDFFYPPKEFEETYGVSSRIPIHMLTDIYGPRYISIMESTGFIQKLMDENNDVEYLKHIGSKKISIVTARNAKNFELLYVQPGIRDFTTSMFTTMYSGSRDYFVNTVYNPYYRNIYEYYDNFIGLSIMHMTIMQVIARAFEGTIARDFYDDRMVQWLFESYGVPYSSKLSYQTQRNLSKNLNMLIMNKGSNKVLYDIATLLGYHDVQIYKYYLVKERRFDINDDLIYKDTTKIDLVYDNRGYLNEEEIVVNDLEKMYDVYFQKVELSDPNYEKALISSSNRVNYDSITQNDPLWWDDDATWEEVYGDPHIYTEDEEKDLWQKHYNYVETKYLGVTISYKLSEILYENIMLLRMIFDMKNQIEDVFVTFPKLTGSLEVTLFDAIVFLCALTCERYHLTGEILTSASKILDVYGYHLEDAEGYVECDTLAFCFDKVTNAETYKEIIKNPSRYLKPDEQEKFFSYFEILTLPDGDVKEKIEAFNKMYSNLTSLGYFIGRKMAESENVLEYYAWKGLYKALYIGKENAEMFNISSDGKVATTYLEYLKVMNPALYNIIDAVDADDEYILYSYIDHVIYRIEQVIKDLNSLYAVNDSNSSAHDYMLKLMKFFKSYTVDFLDMSTQFIFDAKPDNLLKLVEYYKINKLNITEDVYKLMYSDVCHIISTKRKTDPLFFEDFLAIHKKEIIEDRSPINDLGYNKCKKYNCCNFCKNKQSECNGTYFLDGETKKCEHFGLNTSSFEVTCNSIIDEIHDLPDKYTEKVAMMIADMSQYIHSLMNKARTFRTFKDDTATFIQDVVDSTDIYNRIGKRFIAYYGDAFSTTLHKWLTTITDSLSDILVDKPHICKNKDFPCRVGGCELFKKTIDKVELDKVLTLYEHRHGEFFDDMLKIFVTAIIPEEIRLWEDNKYISTYKTTSGDNNITLEDYIVNKAYTKTLEYFGMYDTLKITSHDTQKDNLVMRDHVMIIPSESSE